MPVAKYMVMGMSQSMTQENGHLVNKYNQRRILLGGMGSLAGRGSTRPVNINRPAEAGADLPDRGILWIG